MPRDLPAERALRELLGAWAYGFSDQVSLDLPEAVALEVGGSLKLFRGWPTLERQLRADLAALGLDVALAVAPRPRAAWVLAGVQNGLAIEREDGVRRTLDGLPVSAAGFDDGATAALRSMGFLRLREVAALPRDSLGRRIGPAALVQLDRLYGRAPDPLPGWRPPDGFEAVLEFDARPTAVEPLLFALRRLLADLAAVLHARDGGVQRFRLVLLHEDCPATSVPVGLLRPEREPARLLELSRARLERTVLPAPIAGLALVADELPPFRPVVADLFAGTGDGGSDWPLLLERLRARLGDEAVRRPVEHAEHRPERATGLDPANAIGTGGAARRPAGSRTAAAPAAPPGRRGGPGRPDGHHGNAAIAAAPIAAPAVAPIPVPAMAAMAAMAATPNASAPARPEMPLVPAQDRAPLLTVVPTTVAASTATAATARLPTSIPGTGSGTGSEPGPLPVSTSATAAAPSSAPSPWLSDWPHGPAAPSRPRPRPTSVPDAAAASTATATAIAGQRLDRTRPAWLLPRPIPLRGCPARVLSGPERLESGWWDGGDVRRDYYVIETSQGQRAWAYCPVGRREGWMLHGWFA
jgi:nucleotidyltransferase/DNA polymerase involved in DNA repair